MFFFRAAVIGGEAGPHLFLSLAQVHHLLNLGAEINQPDPRGWTPLHRAAHLAHYDG